MSSNANNVAKNLTNNSSNGSKKTFGIVLIIILAVIVLFFIYSQIKSYISYQKTSPYFIQGIHDATISKKIPGHLVKQPSDSQYGSEFTYSFWLYINDTNFTNLQSVSTCGNSGNPLMKHIFHKGSYDFYQNQSATSGSGQDMTKGDANYHYPILQSPGCWLYPGTNKLNIVFNTYDNVVETADVGNIPLNMWVNITIVLIGNSVDVYVNCNLKKRQKLNGVPKLNYGDLYITNWNGFLGYLSRFRYFNYAIQPYMLDEICKMGPGNQMEQNNNVGQGMANLSPNYWMTTGYPNAWGYPGYDANASQ